MTYPVLVVIFAAFTGPLCLWAGLGMAVRDEAPAEPSPEVLAVVGGA